MMNILYVSRSTTGSPHPFVQEQADQLIRNYGLYIRHYLIRKGGLRGYAQAIRELLEITSQDKPDLIHVHYGLSALAVAVFRLLFRQQLKMVVTFHGSDINKKSERSLSLLASRFAAHNILVSPKMTSFFRDNYSVIPCGIDTQVDACCRQSAREELGWQDEDLVVLFSSSFDRQEKDPDFAFQVIDRFKKRTGKSIKLIELKGYTRGQVTRLMQAADVLLLCSKTEGSPQVVKEAILNGLPVLANDVGDVRAICSEVDHCYVVEKNADTFAGQLELISLTKERVQNKKPVIENFDNNIIAERIFHIYNKILKNAISLATEPVFSR